MSLRNVRAVLEGLRQASELEHRLRGVRRAMSPARKRRLGEYDLVEIAPGVWAQPRRAPNAARDTSLGRLHAQFSRVLDAIEDDRS